MKNNKLSLREFVCDDNTDSDIKTEILKILSCEKSNLQKIDMDVAWSQIRNLKYSKLKIINRISISKDHLDNEFVEFIKKHKYLEHITFVIYDVYEDINEELTPEQKKELKKIEDELKMRHIDYEY